MEKVMWTDLQGERSRLRGSQAATQERRMGGHSVQAACCRSGSSSYPPGGVGSAE